MTELIRVLIADDHPATRADMREAVEQDERFTVVAEATDGAAAVQAALRERPDLCLVDTRILGSGIAATREITTRLPDTKVVMITVSLDDDDLFNSLRAGAIGYLLKDIDPARLPHALNDAVEGGAPIPRRLVARMVAEFRDHAPRRRPVVSEPGYDLTSREWEVLGLLREGLSTAQIAARLMVSRVTVRSHVAAVLRKLGLPNRDALRTIDR
ncbi:MAG TPA: response regulator transcription factor [Gaiellaceae bacterium]